MEKNINDGNGCSGWGHWEAGLIGQAK